MRLVKIDPLRPPYSSKTVSGLSEDPFVGFLAIYYANPFVRVALKKYIITDLEDVEAGRFACLLN